MRPQDTAATRLLDDLAAGVAEIDPETLELRLENARFGHWFPGTPGHLSSRIPEIDPERARERLTRHRPLRLEVERRFGPRTVTIRIELRALPGRAEPSALVEAHDISKQKEAEYLLDSYARMSERQNRELSFEQERSERLLLNIMPRSVYEELRDSGTTTPRSFDEASVLLLDFAGFTDMTISREPGALIAELNDLFTSFDRITAHFRCERIKTIGDAYLAVAGLPDPDPDHAVHLARASLRIRSFIERRNAASSHRWRCRMGLGCGPVIGSVVGVQKFVYDVFGPTVNMAARLEHLAEPGQILVSSEMAARLKETFVLRPMGRQEIRGFGCREIHLLEDEARAGRRHEAAGRAEPRGSLPHAREDPGGRPSFPDVW
jgi:adenylate cyclase